jgi:AraC-like DNA-binding protein
MSAAFRQQFGRSPRELRESLRQSDLRRLQARLRGPGHAGSTVLSGSRA